MQLKCKICGGDMTVDRATGIAVCDYCGTKQTLPQFTDESSELLYNRGNSYLMHNEFDKAENIFNQLLSINPQDAEIYWDLVMCKYGVNFVKDSKSGKYIPTCNRTHYLPIFQDENYQNAIKFSSGDKQEHYKTNARTIDNIQKGIISVSKKEKPFDIFISYKETNADGSRTKDSIEAQKLYEKLTEQGYKVFFSRITLENKAGTQYEPYIYAALSSSKVMLTVCSSRDNIESAWVKNEWSRFLTLRQKDASKTLIPLYFDMPKADLPNEFTILSSQNIGQDDFEQELFRGIKKLIPLPIVLAQKRKKRRKRIGITALVFLIILLIGGIVSYPHIKEYIKNNDSYSNAIQLYNDQKYNEAITEFEKLSGFRDSDDMIEKSKDGIKTLKFNEIMALYNKGNYPEASWGFAKLGDFKNAAEMQKKSELAWRESLATVATDNYTSLSSAGAYYITANGSVKSFSYNPGNAAENIDVNEHGKIISIADHYFNIYALHEDGFVANSKSNNQLESDWDNIIQITPIFNQTNLALKNNGKILCGNISSEYEDNDLWLKETEQWDKVVALSYDFEKFGSGGLMCATLLGLKSDGTIYYTFYGENGYSQEKQFLDNLTDIVKISVNVDPVSETVYIAAIDSQGVIYTCFDGIEGTYEVLDAIDFILNDYFTEDSLENKLLIINNKHELYLYDNDKTILDDVVYINKDFVITQSGSIYHTYNIENENPEKTEAKTEVKDVWTERSFS